MVFALVCALLWIESVTHGRSFCKILLTKSVMVLDELDATRTNVCVVKSPKPFSGRPCVMINKLKYPCKVFVLRVICTFYNWRGGAANFSMQAGLSSCVLHISGCVSPGVPALTKG
jgi:hypothetical protein